MWSMIFKGLWFKYELGKADQSPRCYMAQDMWNTASDCSLEKISLTVSATIIHYYFTEQCIFPVSWWINNKNSTQKSLNNNKKIDIVHFCKFVGDQIHIRCCTQFILINGKPNTQQINDQWQKKRILSERHWVYLVDESTNLLLKAVS